MSGKGKKAKAASATAAQADEDPAVSRVREFERGIGHVLRRRATQAEHARAVPSNLRPRGTCVKKRECVRVCVWIEGTTFSHLHRRS